MGPSQICGCPFREPRVFEIAHMFWPWCLEFRWDEWVQHSTTHKYTVLTTAPVLPRLCHVQCVCLWYSYPHIDRKSIEQEQPNVEVWGATQIWRIPCCCMIVLTHVYHFFLLLRTAKCWGLRCCPNLAHTLLLYECAYTLSIVASLLGSGPVSNHP